ncbi:hypothetical protein ACLOJK_010574 [Asimina triloba]
MAIARRDGYFIRVNAGMCEGSDVDFVLRRTKWTDVKRTSLLRHGDRGGEAHLGPGQPRSAHAVQEDGVHSVIRKIDRKEKIEHIFTWRFQVAFQTVHLEELAVDCQIHRNHNAGRMHRNLVLDPEGDYYTLILTTFNSHESMIGSNVEFLDLESLASLSGIRRTTVKGLFLHTLVIESLTILLESGE